MLWIKYWTKVPFSILLFLFLGSEASNQKLSFSWKDSLKGTQPHLIFDKAKVIGQEESNLLYRYGRKPLISWRKPAEDIIIDYLKSLQTITVHTKSKGIQNKQQEQHRDIVLPCNHNFGRVTSQWMSLNQPLLQQFFNDNDNNYKAFDDHSKEEEINQRKTKRRIKNISKNGNRSMDQKMKVKNSYRYVYLSKEIGHGEKLYRTLVDHLLSWQIHEGSLDTKIYSLRMSRTNSPLLRPPFFSLFFLNRKQEKSLIMSMEKDPLVTLAKITPFGGWILNPCRVSYVKKNKPLFSPSRGIQTKRNIIVGQYSAIGYMTLKGHLLQGEEGIRVRLIRDKKRIFPILKHFPFCNEKSLASCKDQERQKKNDDESHCGDEIIMVHLLSVARGRNKIVNNLIFPLTKGLQHHFFTEQIKSLERVAKLA